MTASLKVKNGIYQIVFSYKDSHGKWRQKSESTGLKEKGNKRRAEAMMKERLDALEVQLSSEPEPCHVLFLNAMNEWLEDVMVHKVRENTLHKYQHVMKKHISTFPAFEGVELRSITSKILQDYVNLKAKTLSPETIRKHYSNIHKFLDYAWKLDMIPQNPADKVELPPRRRMQKGSVYSESQLQSLVELFKGDMLETLVLITATYGLRRSEICGLKWDAIDFDDGPTGSMLIYHTAIDDAGNVIYSDRTKSQTSRRKLPLTPTVKKRLKQLKVEQAEQQLMVGSGYNRLGYICCWPDGTPLLPGYVSRHYHMVINKSSLPYVQLRNLRDSAATLLHKKGFDAKSIQPLLGHADASTTANIYIHSSEDDLYALTDTLEASLSKKSNAG